MEPKLSNGIIGVAATNSGGCNLRWIVLAEPGTGAVVVPENSESSRCQDMDVIVRTTGSVERTASLPRVSTDGSQLALNPMDRAREVASPTARISVRIAVLG